MKLITTSATAAFLLLALWLPQKAYGQTYQLSRPINTLNFEITDLGNIVDGFSIAPGSLTENVIINTGAASIQQTGSIIMPASTQTSMFTETRSLPPIFPNPPQVLTGVITLTMTFGGGTASFDTGAEPVQFNGQNYAFKAGADITFPVEFSYSLVTGNQTYTGSLDSQYEFFLDLDGQLNTDNYPTTITLLGETDLIPAVATIGDFTAANGFQADIVSVPEPSSLAFGGLSAIVLLVFYAVGRCDAQRYLAKVLPPE